jgi:putative tryptophan/tyrosine transport system substrate-binding protein
MTGVTCLFDEVMSKRLALLHELLPAAVGLLVNPANPNAEVQEKGLQQTTSQLGLQFHVLYAKSEADLNSAFAEMTQQQVGALLVGGDGLPRNPKGTDCGAIYEQRNSVYVVLSEASQ